MPNCRAFASSTQIHLDFEVAVEKFKGVPYDILDVAAKQVWLYASHRVVRRVC